MRLVLISVLLLMIAAPASGQSVLQELAFVDPASRTPNWEGERGEGSCVSASLLTAAKWHNLDETVGWWPFSGGETSTSIMRKLDTAGLRYIATEEGDPALLHYASRNRLVVVIFYKDRHCVNFLGFQNGVAVVLDNNHVQDFEYYQQDAFIQKWQSQHKGFAFVLLYPPAPPIPVEQFAPGR